MKKYMLASIVLASLSVLTISFFKKEKTNAAQGFAVVELFTSEGCSSCPPADEAVSEIAKEYPNNVFILGFHVDYWNYLGWKDAFSSSAYSSRQKEYAAILNLNSVYTPEIIVNGKTEFVGSDKHKLELTITKELRENMIKPIDASAKSVDANNVLVTVKTESSPGEFTTIALVQLQGQSDVKKGENNGRQLHHINIVRGLKTIDESANPQSVNLELPKGSSPKDFSVIVFSQNKKSWKVDNAKQINIQ